MSKKWVLDNDIDHLSVREHIFKDLIIPKYIFWSILELIKRKISLKILFKKIVCLFKKNAWNNMEELLEFDKQNKINSTFFVAVNNGKGLSYSTRQARRTFDLIKKYNFDIGVHGICYDDYREIKKEYESFKKITGLNKFGIRMHYLRLNKNTIINLAKTGYLFDSTILSENLDQEYKINGITEIPFHIMDGNFLGPCKNLTLEKAKEKTLELLQKAEEKNKNYVAIMFHQRHFSEEFPQYKNYYIWLINHCKEKKYEFINHRDLL